MRILIFTLFSILFSLGWSNQITTQIAEKLQSDHPKNVEFLERIPLTSALQSEFQLAEYFSIESKVLKSFKSSDADFIRIPANQFQMFGEDILAFEVSPFADGAKIKTSSGKELELPNIKFYRGQFVNDPTSVITIMISEAGMEMAVLSQKGDFNLTKLENGNYLLFSMDGLNNPDRGVCGVEESEVSHMERMIESGRRAGEHLNKLVTVYFEVAYTVVTSKGSVQGAADYIAGAFSQVQALYTNEEINVAISEMFIWDSPSPYDNGSQSTDHLYALRANRQGFNGDIAHVVNMQSNLGGVAYLDVLCVPSYAFGYSGLRTSYNNVPTYSWTIEVLTHEIGHNLGSPHTQSCSWPGGAIDNCYTTEGGCAPGPAPTNGGTIMSYCHLTSTGINFNNGFGPLPGDLIRGKVGSASCLGNVDGGGGDPEPEVCDAVSNLRALNIAETSFDLAWDGGVSTNAYNIFINGSNIGPGGVDGASITGAQASTSYQVYIETACPSGTRVNSAQINVTTADPAGPAEYCIPSGNGGYFIDAVSTNNVTVTSGNNGGFLDNTATLFSIQNGGSINIVPGSSAGNARLTARVWIDWNEDGVFDDTTERIGQSKGRGTRNISLAIADFTGQRRMRVALGNSNMLPCDNGITGEFEDYSVSFGGTASGGGGSGGGGGGKGGGKGKKTLADLDLSLSPNPVGSNSYTYLTIEASEQQTEVNVFDMAGKLIGQYQLAPEVQVLPLSTSGMASGTYIIQLTSGNEVRQMKLMIRE